MRFFVVLLPLLLVASFAADPVSSPAVPPPPGQSSASPAAELRWSDAVILGVIEGVTEFLPVSSTGHMIIANRMLGLNSAQPIFGRDGAPLWHVPPGNGQPGELLSIKVAADTYVVVIQFGAIAAVALVYWRKLLSMFWGVMGRDPAGQRLFKSVMIAFVPAAGLGFLIRDWINQHMFYVETVIFAQIAGALLMFYAEYWYGKNLLAGTRLERTELTGAGALGVGLLQCAALVPGTSRSMMTIVGAYFGGLDPRRAAEFSFILGFVTLTAASIYKSLQSGAAVIQVFGWPHVILGAAVAAITAAICVRFMIHWLVRYGLAVFAWYRIVMAGVLWVYFYW